VPVFGSKRLDLTAAEHLPRSTVPNLIRQSLKLSFAANDVQALVEHRPHSLIALINGQSHIWPSPGHASAARNVGLVRRRLVNSSRAGYICTMCNLYSMTRSREAILRLFRVADNRAGEIIPQPSIFPAYTAPVVR
jgi:hypothetical protein